MKTKTCRWLRFVFALTLWAQTISHAQTPQVLNESALRSARIGVVQGSAHDTYAQKNLQQAQIFQFVSVSDLVLAVESGHVQAGISDEEGLRVLMKEKPQLAPVGASLFQAQVGAGFHKNSSQLRSQFNAFITTIQADGTWQDMVQRWTRDGNYAMPQISFPKNAPPLKVGNAIIGLPLVAVKDGQLVGFEIEMAMRFAAHLGRKPQWQTLDWNALIPALASQRIDLIVSSMYITPERQQRINFSNPYYESGNFFFVHASGGTHGQPNKEGGAWQQAWRELKSSFQSNLIHEDRYRLLGDGLWVTMKLAVLSALWGTLLGACVCAMRMSSKAWMSWPARVYISVLRGTPVLVLLMIVFYVVFASTEIDPMAIAVLAFGLNFGAYTAEIFRSGVQSIDRGQTEAGIAMGFNPLSTLAYIILPQTLLRVLPVYKGEFISMVKMTSIVGYVTVQDLTKASDIIRSRTFDAFFPLIMVALLYFAISWVLIQFLEYLERSTDPVLRRQRRT